jgi:hypothetical protein
MQAAEVLGEKKGIPKKEALRPNVFGTATIEGFLFDRSTATLQNRNPRVRDRRESFRFAVKRA